MSLSPTDIKSIVTALSESDWDEAIVTVGDSTISLARHGAGLGKPSTSLSTHALVPDEARPSPATPELAPHPIAAPTTPATAPATADIVTEQHEESTAGIGDFVVTAPSVGVLWRSPEPGAAPFAAIGDRLEIGDTICIVEIMKLMNNVSTPVAGVLTAAHVANGGAVEAGDPMFSIRID